MQRLRFDVEVPVSAHDIVRQMGRLSRDDVIDFMLALDLEMADTDFTEELIDKLKTSLEEEGK